MYLNIEELQKMWLMEEASKLNATGKNKPKRKYTHFDYRLPEISLENVKFVWMPDKIIGHSFYPFVKNNVIARKYKKNEPTKIINKPRDIYYASHKDALIFSWYNFILNQLYQHQLKLKNIDQSVIAYRSLHKSNVEFVLEVINFIKKIGDCVVLCFDIEKFFDKLNHAQIKNQWKKTLGLEPQEGLPADHYAVYKAITKFAFIDLDSIKKEFGKTKTRFCTPADLRARLSRRGKIHKNKNDFGIPQGSPISTVISNFYMLDFDEKIFQYAQKYKGIYRRYSDDIVLVIPIEAQKDPLEILSHAENYISEQIGKQHLNIQEKKTEKRIFKRRREELLCFDALLNKSSMQYLGITFDGKCFDLRGSTWARYYRKLAKMIKSKTFRFLENKEKAFSRKKIYDRFTDFGCNNFITYAGKANILLDSTNIGSKILRNRLIKGIKKRIAKEINNQKKNSPSTCA